MHTLVSTAGSLTVKASRGWSDMLDASVNCYLSRFGDMLIVMVFLLTEGGGKRNEIFCLFNLL